jgi:hypothetical protein
MAQQRPVLHQSKHGVSSLRRSCLPAIVDEHVAKEGGGLRTIDDRRAALERLVLPTLGARQIHDISRTDIVRLLDRIASERGRRWLTTY